MVHFEGTGLEENTILVFTSDHGEILYEHEYYFGHDIAYHYNKFLDRGFERVIDIWGADHHGYIPRMKAAFSVQNM
jgi:arginyl-tRNA synthetase